MSVDHMIDNLISRAKNDLDNNFLPSLPLLKASSDLENNFIVFALWAFVIKSNISDKDTLSAIDDKISQYWKKQPLASIPEFKHQIELAIMNKPGNKGYLYRKIAGRIMWLKEYALPGKKASVSQIQLIDALRLSAERIVFEYQ
ncbi:MAG: hypothetical protein MRY78_10580 [Saprospiraceae bacterium]|nr:hypothetical protein [Saprospiraceae bacterium]